MKLQLQNPGPFCPGFSCPRGRTGHGESGILMFEGVVWGSWILPVPVERGNVCFVMWYSPLILWRHQCLISKRIGCRYGWAWLRPVPVRFSLLYQEAAHLHISCQRHSCLASCLPWLFSVDWEGQTVLPAPYVGFIWGSRVFGQSCSPLRLLCRIPCICVLT